MVLEEVKLRGAFCERGYHPVLYINLERIMSARGMVYVWLSTEGEASSKPCLGISLVKTSWL
jgi:hypothetical protein